MASDDVEAARAAAARCADLLVDAVRQRGSASFAVSGGATPSLMFDAMVGLDVPWRVVTVLQVDERVAPDGHPDRNATALVERLLVPAGVPRDRWRLMPVTRDDLEVAAAECATLVDSLAPLDVVHLGLGDDGHTASWPPGDPVVESTASVALSGVYRGRRRMTLTPGAVNDARTRVVLVTGSSKAEAVRRWIAGDPDVPAHLVARDSTVAFLDRDAASRC